ncbi:S8 family serine peptidase [Kribbella sandramycini]|uniref:S8 family serine peptidase n=1 Tax=Kribbella sandramycini TaxID=60450 RepID=A0A7Y4KYF8_9ACTN|nr:S8 family peptidase [Kribbella sandramycini]MBB6567413.1 subtilisin family serine protease [Kribbella sandramycini]NOL39976.1 S8 family serine peptidase [Kribbella sandramycini]
MRKRTANVFGAAFVTIGLVAMAAPTAQAAEGVVRDAASPAAVAGKYLVALKDAPAGKVRAPALRTRADGLSGKFGGSVGYVYDQVFGGYSAQMTAAQARRLAADPSVAYVQQVQTRTVADTQPNPPNWGDDRIDQRDLPLNKSFSYPANAGQGATVYVLDTGINANHQDFSGRVKQGIDYVDGDSNPADCQGHGTHVAGSAVGTTYGVAKKANVVAVRILDCQGNGQDDDILAGMNWIKSNAVKPAVVNYSVGCRSRCTSDALDNAVKAIIASGVQFVQAAGNNNDDACYYSPQRVPAAITVGNSTISDARYTGTGPSSYGSCLDIWAPGTNIISASYSSNTGTATMTGTSMASPHVAGAAALYLGSNPSATPQQVRDALVNNGSTGKLTGINSGSPNVLLYTAFIGGDTPTGPSVTNPGNQSTAVGGTANLQLQASGGTSPYTWSASGLPAGLSLDSATGKITGSPTTQNSYNVTVTATDAAGKTGQATFTWTIGGTGGCTAAQVVGNSGFENGSTPWSANAYVIGSWAQQAAHGGSRYAWLGGQGAPHTDYASQSVTIPSGCATVTLRFWLHIDTAETENVAYDKLTVTLGSTTLATYSNLNKAGGYVEKVFDVKQFAGQTATLKFNGVEDQNLQTSFVVDDVTLSVS